VVVFRRKHHVEGCDGWWGDFAGDGVGDGVCRRATVRERQSLK